MREVQFGNDGDYSTKSVVTRINSDLANDLGNLLNTHPPLGAGILDRGFSSGKEESNGKSAVMG